MTGALAALMFCLWQPLPQAAQDELGACSMLVGDTTIVVCADGRVLTS